MTGLKSHWNGHLSEIPLDGLKLRRRRSWLLASQLFSNFW